MEKALLLLILFFSTNIFADTIWNNGAPNPQLGGPCNDCHTLGQSPFDNFIVGGNVTVTGFTFMSGTFAQANMITDYRDTHWYLFSSFPQPGGVNAIASGNAVGSLTPTGTATGAILYETVFNIPPIQLGPGMYWIAFRNNSVHGQADSFGLETGLSPLPGGVGSLHDNFIDGDPRAELSFTVEGTPVPEPASLLLLAGGLTGLHLRRTRKIA